jgi:hypothetical protein
MGYGGYSYEAHEAITRSREAAPVEEVFRQTRCHPLMDPRGVKARECRDSIEHPRSLPIVLALDVTGSMGEIPEQLARRELPGFMKLLLDQGVADPQVLFMAVGDAFSDDAPLQVGQFESTAELMDQWLTWTWLEGQGGGGDCESYDLALHFCARHLETDAWRLRKQRGYLFMTGDERPYPRLSRAVVQKVLGDSLEEDLPLSVVVEEAERAFEPFFLFPDLDRRARCERTWRDVLGDNVIAMESPRDMCAVAAGIVALGEGAAADVDALAARLSALGHARDRIGAVVRALTPWAATLGRDGMPSPDVDAGALLPMDAGESRHRRPGA